MIRYYRCPLVLEADGGRYAKVRNYMPGDTRLNLCVINSSPSKNWCVAFCSGTDLAVIPDTDTECEDLYEKLSDRFGTREEVLNYLRTTTFGDLSTGQRRRVKDRLAAWGVVTTDLGNTVFLYEGLRRLCALHDSASPDQLGL